MSLIGRWNCDETMGLLKPQAALSQLGWVEGDGPSSSKKCLLDMLRCEQLSSDHQDGMRGRVKCHQHSSVFSLFKFKSLCVRQGENRDFDTYKEVKKYENIIIER